MHASTPMLRRGRLKEYLMGISKAVCLKSVSSRIVEERRKKEKVDQKLTKWHLDGHA